ncbi:MAG: hypothetical protein IKI90_06010 [Treponema sp.]|nr:hypothetical protein [Treponema sp.]MBR4005387.1 hypothetical protein [Treponema sp.]
MKRLVTALLAFLIPLGFLAAQSSLPDGYAGIHLGMSVDEVKEALKKDGQFGYRGDRDVSLLPGENRSIIETDTSRTAPYSFLDRCWFQFYEDKLYIITINIKTEKMDHYSVFSTLCNKYGLPSSLNPSKSEWVNDSVMISLERPLSIKYTDKKVFDSLMEQSRVDNAVIENNQQHFLEGL